MNKEKRLKFLKAMELIALSCRSEKAAELWEIEGIAPNNDGTPEDEWLDFYTRDENFAEVMHAFLLTMKKTAVKGGIECDGVLSI